MLSLDYQQLDEALRKFSSQKGPGMLHVRIASRVGVVPPRATDVLDTELIRDRFATGITSMPYDNAIGSL